MSEYTWHSIDDDGSAQDYVEGRLKWKRSAQARYGKGGEA